MTNVFPVLYDLTVRTEPVEKINNLYGMLVIKNNPEPRLYLLNYSSHLNGSRPADVCVDGLLCNSWWLGTAPSKRKHPLDYTEDIYTVHVRPLPPGCPHAKEIKNLFNLQTTDTTKVYTI